MSARCSIDNSARAFFIGGGEIYPADCFEINTSEIVAYWIGGSDYGEEDVDYVVNIKTRCCMIAIVCKDKKDAELVSDQIREAIDDPVGIVAMEHINVDGRWTLIECSLKISND